MATIFGRDRARAEAIEEAGALAGDRIGLRQIGEGKEAPRVSVALSEGCPKRQLNSPAPRPRHVRRSRRRTPSGRARPRRARGRGDGGGSARSATRRRRRRDRATPAQGLPARRVAEAQEGAGVPHRREAEPDERRALGAIVAVVDLAGLEARLEVHVAVIRHDVGAGAAGEAPGPPRDDRGRRAGVLADRQLGVRIVEAGDRMRKVVPIRERAARRPRRSAGTRSARDPRSAAGRRRPPGRTAPSCRPGAARRAASPPTPPYSHAA